jgi:hypothetical protein
MCRSIHTLYSVDQPVTQGEIHAAALQFVRKISGFHAPSALNASAFQAAVDEIEASSARLLDHLQARAATREPVLGDGDGYHD